MGLDVAGLAEQPRMWLADFVALAPDTADQGCLADISHPQNIPAQPCLQNTAIFQPDGLRGVAGYGGDGARQIIPHLGQAEG